MTAKLMSTSRAELPFGLPPWRKVPLISESVCCLKYVCMCGVNESTNVASTQWK